MLKYSVVKNATTANSRHCVAHVSSPESKNLDDVVDYMIAEGTGLTRPANQRFKKGWLNRLVDFRFFPTIVCILALVLCLSGCKSIPSETKLHSQSEANEKIENDVVVSNDKQSDRNVESHSLVGQRSVSLAVHCSGNNRNNNRMLCFILEMLAFVKNFAPFEIRFCSL